MRGLWALVAWLGIGSDGARPFPDVPANHWVYEGLAHVKRDGLAVGLSDGLGYPARKAPTASEAFTRVAFGMWNLRELAEDMVRDRKGLVALMASDERVGTYDADLRALRGMRAHLAFFRSAQREFFPQFLLFRRLSPREFPSVGKVESALNRALALGPVGPTFQARPFRDVPPTHWAAKAVGDLRALGLLDGYPDGRFRG